MDVHTMNDLAKIADTLVEQGDMERLAELYCRLRSLLEAVSLLRKKEAKALQDKQLHMNEIRLRLDSYRK